jgi:hypothetical protein
MNKILITLILISVYSITQAQTETVGTYNKRTYDIDGSTFYETNEYTFPTAYVKFRTGELTMLDAKYDKEFLNQKSMSILLFLRTDFTKYKHNLKTIRLTYEDNKKREKYYDITCLESIRNFDKELDSNGHQCVRINFSWYNLCDWKIKKISLCQDEPQSMYKPYEGQMEIDLDDATATQIQKDMIAMWSDWRKDVLKEELILKK